MDAAALPATLRRRDLVRYVMSCDPLLRWPMLFWLVGLSAAPPDRCLRSAPSAQSHSLLSLTLQAAIPR